MHFHFSMCGLQMCLLFGTASLADIHPPCVLQSFVNHGAVLYKVYVVGDKHCCVERPSIKNFPSGPCGQFPTHQDSFCLSLLLLNIFLLPYFALTCFSFPSVSSFQALASRFLHSFLCAILCHIYYPALLCVNTRALISLWLQTGRPSSSTAIRCPNRRQTLTSRLWVAFHWLRLKQQVKCCLSPL